MKDIEDWTQWKRLDKKDRLGSYAGLVDQRVKQEGARYFRHAGCVCGPLLVFLRMCSHEMSKVTFEAEP
jgi:hypothetical protein